jgi:hypothetical protein
MNQDAFLRDWNDPPDWMKAAVRSDSVCLAVYGLAKTSNMGKEDFLIRLARAQFESRRVLINKNEREAQ